jgi:hypothetical protein
MNWLKRMSPYSRRGFIFNLIALLMVFIALIMYALNIIGFARFFMLLFIVFMGVATVFYSLNVWKPSKR